eukprot:8327354-Alexandrium_andersonii.AAC.1
MRWKTKLRRRPSAGICPRLSGGKQTGYYRSVLRARNQRLRRRMGLVEREGLRRVVWLSRRAPRGRSRPPPR